MGPRRGGVLLGARQGRRERSYQQIRARERTPHRVEQRVPATQCLIVRQALGSGIAAGHPATADAGAEILDAGGSAADAAVAASLASCVAETVMTGLLGGGHALWWDAIESRAELLDFFVAVPGLGAEPGDVELVEMQVPFGAEMIHYAVGVGSCAVPGVPQGLGALWERHGRLPWPRVVEPAVRLARDGVAMPAAHASCLAMLAPVMTMREGARIYAPGDQLLEAGDRLEQPGLARALELLADEGPATMATGTVARGLLAAHGGARRPRHSG